VVQNAHYEVSNLGRFRRGKCILKPFLNTGYLRIDLQGRRYYAHRLVLDAFVGPCPDSWETAHLDGNRQNNVLKNLRWVSRIENSAHKHKHGTMYCGVRQHNAKLSPVKVRGIRDEYARGRTTLAKLGLKYGVDSTAIHDVISGRTWKHVD
jgi:hypothetical protein